MADICAAVLEKDIFAVIGFTSYEHLERDYYKWIKDVDDSRARQAQSAGIDLTLPVEGAPVGLGADFSSDEWSNWTKTRESITQDKINRTTVLNAFRRVPDRTLIGAWRDCALAQINALAKEAGLQMTVEAKPTGQIQVVIKYAIEGDAIAPVKVESLVPLNATLMAGLVPTELKSNTPHQLVYTWTNPKAPASFSLQTDRGVRFDHVEPKYEPLVITEKLGGPSYSANAGPVKLQVKRDQTIRVFGGATAKYAQSGNPQGGATAVLTINGANPVTLLNTQGVQLHLYPSGAMHQAHLYGVTYDGTLVGVFDQKIQVKEGDIVELSGTIQAHHGVPGVFLLYIEHSFVADSSHLSAVLTTMKAMKALI